MKISPVKKILLIVCILSVLSVIEGIYLNDSLNLSSFFLFVYSVYKLSNKEEIKEYS